MADLKFRPLSDRLVVEREEATDVHEGLFIPESAQEQSQVGRVVAAGPGKVSEFPVVSSEGVEFDPSQASPKEEAVSAEFRRMPMVVGVGDRIVFAKWGGSEVQIGRDEFLFVRQSDVLAIILEEESDD